MSKPYKVHSKEFGEGKVYTEKFETLKHAAKYIRDRWQGGEYKDGSESFHTDYSTYTCEGFILADIGEYGPIEDGWRDFVIYPEEKIPDHPRKRE